MAVTAASPALASRPAHVVPSSAVASSPLYKTPAYDYLYKVVDGRLATVNYEEWRDAYGFQTPVAAASTFSKHSWSPTIFSVSRFPGTEEPIVGVLSTSQWRSVGSPTPKTEPLVEGDSVVKWASSSELFIRTTYREVHKLTPAEWAATGYAAASQLPDGFVKLTWASNIVLAPTIDPPGAGLQVPGNYLSYDEWAAYGFPTPLAVQRFQNDRFQQTVGSPVISYMGPTFYNSVTYDQWVAAGSPRPILYRCDQTTCERIPNG